VSKKKTFHIISKQPQKSPKSK